MRIKHVTIQNAGKSNKDFNHFDAVYTIHVNLSYTPDRVWKHYFYKNWQKEFQKRKKVRIIDNEIRLLLAKNEDIQHYIDCVKNTIRTTNKFTDSQKRKAGLEAL